MSERPSSGHRRQGSSIYSPLSFHRPAHGWKPVMNLAEMSPSILAPKVVPIAKFNDARSGVEIHFRIPKDPKEQEALMMEDVLYIFTGIEGSFIRFSDSFDPNIQSDKLKGPEFRISKNLDPSLKDLTVSIVSVAKHYCALRAFVDYESGKNFGRVNQALCSSIRGILKDYLLLISQLEKNVLYNPNCSLHYINLQLNNSVASLFKHLYDVTQLILAENHALAEKVANSNSFDDLGELLQRIKDTKTYDIDDLAQPKNSRKSAICKGGSTLRLLARRLELMSGDPVAKALLEKLLAEASRPYLQMLIQWINQGLIDDPHDEFLIAENRTGYDITHDNLGDDLTDEYWEARYTVRKDELPLQLSNPDVYEKVLLAGKYLNVIREYGRADHRPHDASDDQLLLSEEDFSSIEDSRIVVCVTTAYTRANALLLNLLMGTLGLSKRLNSLKHYFFLDRADYFINFCDIAESELAKPSRAASVTKLQYLLDMALRQPGSISSEDPFKEEVLVSLSHVSVSEYLLQIVNVMGVDPNEIREMAGATGADFVNNMILAAHQSSTNNPGSDDKKNKSHTVIMGLELDFKIPFPLSLVISRNSILRYQFLFRHLIELKNIERQFNKAWIEQTKSSVWKHKSENHRLMAWKTAATKLKTRMLLFIQQVLYFCTMEVIEPNWGKLIKSLESARNVDLVIKQHLHYLDTCLKECLLTNPKLLKVQAKLFVACRMFAEFLLVRQKTLVLVDPTVLPERERAGLKKMVSKSGQELTPNDLMEYLQSTLSQYESSFDHHLKVFMEALSYYAATESSVFLSLCARLEVVGHKQQV